MIVIPFLQLWDISGKLYHDYALTYPQYKKTNEALITFADMTPDSIVVDLACGTGLTTLEILKRFPAIKKIYAIDFSRDMITTAQNIINATAVTFIVADAQDIDTVVPEKVDNVVCNSAFWQFPHHEKVITAISHILRDDGTVIFNLNQQFFDFGSPEPNQKLIMNTLFSEMRAQGFEPTGKLTPHVTKEQIETLFNLSGFTLIKTESVDIGPRSLEDFFHFFRIPATATFFEGIPREKQEQILNAAYEKLRDQRIAIAHNRWIYFMFKKIPPVTA